MDEQEREEATHIAEMEALARLFSDSTVRNAVDRVRKDYGAQMLSAKTGEDREKVWLRARALEDIMQEFQSTNQNGKLAKIKADKRKATSVPKSVSSISGTGRVRGLTFHEE